MKVLIAEDDLTSLTILTSIISEWGYEVIAVHDGSQALIALQAENAPHLLLIDWEMPHINGLALCKYLREKEDFSNSPYIIMLTNRSETKDVVEGLKSGANDYISKPFDNSELQARLLVGKRILDLQYELNKAKEEMAIQANHDALTGLYNRRVILEIMDKEIERTKRYSQPLFVCMCDIDNFKNVNDTYGHLAGDAILHEVAQRLSTSLRPYDSCGRYGGEEFLIILNSDLESSSNLFERIRSIISDTPFSYNGKILNISISLGIATYSPLDEICTTTQLLNLADTALYKAKNSGRNRVIFSTCFSSKKNI